MSTYEAHPAAAAWPMLPEPDLRRLAEDIRVNGLIHPIVIWVDKQRRHWIIDGRNRYAACQIAGMEPQFVEYDDDPVAYVLSANNERRHMSLPERAAATALTLATNGHRQDGRWTYGKVSETSPDSQDLGNWTECMRRAGLVLDHSPDLLPRVAAGNLALDAAVREATAKREERKRRAELPEDLGVLVDNGELTINDALRRAKLTARYAALVAEGRLTISEAEDLNDRDDREHREAIQRHVNGVLSFLAGWNSVRYLADDPNRDEVLDQLSDFDRDRVQRILKETTWPSTQI